MFASVYFQALTSVRLCRPELRQLAAIFMREAREISPYNILVMRVHKFIK